MKEGLDLSKYQDKKLIAFDLYGTCIDHPFKGGLSGDLIKFMEKNPITIQDIQEGKVEKDGTKIQITDTLIEYIRKDIEGTLLFSETLEALKYVKDGGYRTAVISNLSKDYAQPLRKLIPEGMFNYEVLSFNVGAVKPEQKIYEYLKSLSGMDFKDMVIVGDSLKSDVIGSNNVGITPIHLNRTSEGISEQEKLGIKFIQISTLTDLKNIL